MTNFKKLRGEGNGFIEAEGQPTKLKSGRKKKQNQPPVKLQDKKE